MRSSYQKFAKDTLIIGVTNVLVALSGIILLSLVTKTLGAHDYGIWAQVQVTITLVTSFSELGLPFAMTRFLAAKTNREEIQEGFYSVFSLVFFVTLLFSLLLIMLASPVARAFFDGGPVEIIRITGFIIVVWSAGGVCLGLFRTFRQVERYSLFVLADNFGQIGLIAYLVLNGHGLLSIVFAVLAVKVVIFSTLFFLIKQQIGIKRPHFRGLKEYLSFGLPTIPSNVAAWVIASSNRYIIGYFLGSTWVGVYSAGSGLGGIPLMMAGVLGFVLPPTLSKLYDEGRMDEVKTDLSYSLKWLLMIAIPFVWGAAVFSKQVLRFFSTAEIAAQGYYVVPLIALATLILCICVPFGHILILVKKTRITGVAYILAALINLGLNLLLVPVWGILGAAISAPIAYSVLLVIQIHYSLREFTFDIDWYFVIKSLIASAIMSLVIRLVYPQSNSATIIMVIAGVAVYGVVLFLLKGFKKEEFRFFRGLFQRSVPATNPDDKTE